jgi:hypothetical protein
MCIERTYSDEIGFGAGGIYEDILVEIELS